MNQEGIEQTIGNYKINSELGEGTFGKVTLGVHQPTGQKVAIKTLQKQKIIDPSDIQRVTREICILKILRHPNIIQLYEIIETKTDIHLIMQYAQGGQLFDHIVKKKRLPQAQAINFLQQVLSGVEYIHKNGIVHRDLKPQNLLLDDKLNIKIVDFGLSNQYKPGQKLKTACGSPCYAAPQMIAGKRYECINVDIWSCGIILYAMLCGYLPFEDPNTNKLYKKIMGGDFDMPRILTPESKQMLKHILNVNPETRYKIAQIRQSKWYNSVQNVYKAQGIIVKKDKIEIDNRVVKLMQKSGFENSQIVNYVVNNRHNHITAHYYLLKKKGQKNPSIFEPQVAEPPSDSLIYRPQKKDFFIPMKKIISDMKESNKNNESFNASTIISSLVEANKTKLGSVNILANKLIKKQQKFQDFRLFPNKNNSSIYQPSLKNESKAGQKATNNKDKQTIQDKLMLSLNIKKDTQNKLGGAMTSRNQTQDRYGSLNYKEARPQTQRFSLIAEPKDRPTGQIQSGSIAKKKQDLSDQLRQISQKIDREIIQLRKQNNTGAVAQNSRIQKDSLGPQIPRPSTQTSRTKAQSFFSGMKKEGGQTLQLTKRTDLKQNISNRFPKIHIGPFNVQCLFMTTPAKLIAKIAAYLSLNSTRYEEVDAFTLKVSQQERISIQTIQGMVGYYLVSFSLQQSSNDKLIEYLSA